MEFFLPPILLMLFAFFASTYVLPNFTPVILGAGALVFLAIAIYMHYATFASEYKVMQWADLGQQIAPTLLTSLVIVLTVGYMVYMFGGGATPSLPMPSSNIPPPATATNFMTEAIGNGLVSMGMANVDRNARPIGNSAHRNVVASALSAGV